MLKSIFFSKRKLQIATVAVINGSYFLGDIL